MKIYTKTGDKGETSLLGGQRVEKNHPKLKAYGTIDELNSHLGLLVAFVHQEKVPTKNLVSDLTDIQRKLFLLGSHIACQSEEDIKNFKLKEFSEKFALELEQKIDLNEKTLPPLKNFILPSGSLSTSQAHVCRTICRRAERLVSSTQTYNKNWLIYLNRLSDYLFSIARKINADLKIADVIWTQD